MRLVAYEEQPKRIGSSMELKQVHGHSDDDGVVDPGPKFDPSDDDDDDLEERIATAHHRFEDDIDTVSLLSASPPSPGRAELGMAQVSNRMMKRTSARILGLIGVIVFAVFIGTIVGFTYTGTPHTPHTKSKGN